MSDEFKASAIIWMRHVQSILTGLSLAGILWVAKTVYEVDKKVASLDLQTMYSSQLDASQTKQILNLQEQMNGAVTSIEVIKNDIELLKRYDRRRTEAERTKEDG